MLGGYYTGFAYCGISGWLITAKKLAFKGLEVAIGQRDTMAAIGAAGEGVLLGQANNGITLGEREDTTNLQQDDGKTILTHRRQ